MKWLDGHESRPMHVMAMLSFVSGCFWPTAVFLEEPPGADSGGDGHKT